MRPVVCCTVTLDRILHPVEKNKNKLYIEKLMARKSLMTSWQNKGEKV